LRTAIDQTLAGDEKELLHLEAGALRAQFGQFTAAAYHYAIAGEGEIAIELLDAHKEEEIDQGQADAALAVLNRISPRRIGKAAQEKAALLRAELQKLIGHYDDARATLQTV
jgi:hypothetical protein